MAEVTIRYNNVNLPDGRICARVTSALISSETPEMERKLEYSFIVSGLINLFCNKCPFFNAQDKLASCKGFKLNGKRNPAAVLILDMRAIDAVSTLPASSEVTLSAGDIFRATECINLEASQK